MSEDLEKVIQSFCYKLLDIYGRDFNRIVETNEQQDQINMIFLGTESGAVKHIIDFLSEKDSTEEEFLSFVIKLMDSVKAEIIKVLTSGVYYVNQKAVDETFKKIIECIVNEKASLEEAIKRSKNDEYIEDAEKNEDIEPSNLPNKLFSSDFDELIKLGLNADKLSVSAQEIILDDYLASKNLPINGDLIDANGNYQRQNPNGLLFSVIPNDDFSFTVITRSKQGPRDVFCQVKEYSSFGIEFRRESFIEGHPVKDIITREDNLVVVSIQRINTSNNEVVFEEHGFINPTIKSGRTLAQCGGYQKDIDGFMTEPRTQEEIAAIIDFLQGTTGLSPKMYTKNGESIINSNVR